MPDTHDERQDLRSPSGRFANFLKASEQWGPDLLLGTYSRGLPEIVVALGDMRGTYADLRQVRQQLAAATARAEKVEVERDGHRVRQREAEDALAMLLAREGGSVEFSVAEMTSFSRRGSFVSSRNIATGGERLAYVTAASKPGSSRSETANAAQEAHGATETAEEGAQASREGSNSSATTAGLSGRELFADACDCECQPGQPCLCPERDCYCGPCPVCGDNPQRTDDTTEDDR
jgi:hypothetical protein